MSDIEVFKNINSMMTLDNEQIKKINERLPEYHRANAIIGHSTSQTSYSLQTMQMISDSPLSRMKQCLAQIGKKYNALQENYFKIEEKKLRIKTLQQSNTEQSRLTIRKLEAEIHTTSVAMENAFRQMGMFQDMYDSIKKANNIPDNWSEKDFEKQEIANMVRSSFRIAVQDLSASGRVSKAAVEYWEQLGIHPQIAEVRTRKYLTDTQLKINNNDYVSIQEMYTFLDEMVNEFGNEYKKSLKRIGLNEIGSEEFMAKGVTKPQ